VTFTPWPPPSDVGWVRGRTDLAGVARLRWGQFLPARRCRDEAASQGSAAGVNAIRVLLLQARTCRRPAALAQVGEGGMGLTRANEACGQDGGIWPERAVTRTARADRDSDGSRWAAGLSGRPACVLGGWQGLPWAWRYEVRAAGPVAQIRVTSRERLGLQSEWVRSPARVGRRAAPNPGCGGGSRFAPSCPWFRRE
jgi:hypothetical protein